jgi:hypothetical protein
VSRARRYLAASAASPVPWVREVVATTGPMTTPPRAGIAGLAASLEGLPGEVTQETVLATIKGMPETERPNGGGLMFQRNGEQVPDAPRGLRPGLARHDARRGGAAHQVRAHRGIARTAP